VEEKDYLLAVTDQWKSGFLDERKYKLMLPSILMEHKSTVCDLKIAILV
jgi:hypothetical protein